MGGRSPGVGVLLAAASLVFCARAAATELSLSDAIKMALAHEYRIKAAAGDSAAAEYRLQATRALRFPTLSLDARSYYVSYVPEFSLLSHTLELGVHENSQADFTLSVPLYTGGRLSNSVAVARETSHAESARLETERMAVAAGTRGAYLNLMLAASAVDIADASLKRLAIIRADVQNLFDNGLADSVDVLDAEAAVIRARRVVDQAKTGDKNAIAFLAAMIGMEDETSITPTEALSLGDTSGVVAAAVPLEIARAELRRLDHLIAAADESVALAKAEYLPSIAGFGGYSVGKPNKDMFNKTWNDYFSVGVSLSWELNFGGKAGRTADAARQSAQSARMSRRSLEEALIVQAATALNNLKHALTVVASTASEYDIARRRFELARQKEKAGELAINRFLEMETDLTVTELQHRTAVIRYHLARTEYQYAVGSPDIFGGLE
jgi:outer membrane protein